MADHEAHTFDSRRKPEPCRGCQRTAIVCPMCTLCTLCLSDEMYGRELGELVKSVYGDTGTFGGNRE